MDVEQFPFPASPLLLGALVSEGADRLLGTAPILVTGSHRSGTTWTGRMLTLSGETFEVHEPFNPTIYRTWLRNRPKLWFQHINESNASVWEPEIARVLRLQPAALSIACRGRSPKAVTRAAQIALGARRARRRGQRVLLKDPIAFFAAEWLAERFGTHNIVLIRHPAAFASSLKRLDWRFDFRNFTQQEHLLTGDLREFADEIVAAARQNMDVIDQSILLWRIFAARSLHYRRVHPHWTVVRYEDLASDPLAGFAALYARLGLTWSGDVQERVEKATGAGNVGEVPATERGGVHRHSAEAMWTWLERLTPNEVERVRDGTAQLASQLYSDNDWVPVR